MEDVEMAHVDGNQEEEQQQEQQEQEAQRQRQRPPLMVSEQVRLFGRPASAFPFTTIDLAREHIGPSSNRYGTTSLLSTSLPHQKHLFMSFSVTNSSSDLLELAATGDAQRVIAIATDNLNTPTEIPGAELHMPHIPANVYFMNQVWFPSIRFAYLVAAENGQIAVLRALDTYRPVYHTTDMFGQPEDIVLDNVINNVTKRKVFAIACVLHTPTLLRYVFEAHQAFWAPAEQQQILNTYFAAIVSEQLVFPVREPNESIEAFNKREILYRVHFKPNMAQKIESLLVFRQHVALREDILNTCLVYATDGLDLLLIRSLVSMGANPLTCRDANVLSVALSSDARGYYGLGRWSENNTTVNPCHDLSVSIFQFFLRGQDYHVDDENQQQPPIIEVDMERCRALINYIPVCPLNVTFQDAILSGKFMPLVDAMRHGEFEIARDVFLSIGVESAQIEVWFGSIGASLIQRIPHENNNPQGSSVLFQIYKLLPSDFVPDKAACTEFVCLAMANHDFSVLSALLGGGASNQPYLIGSLNWKKLCRTMSLPFVAEFLRNVQLDGSHLAGMASCITSVGFMRTVLQNLNQGFSPDMLFQMVNTWAKSIHYEYVFMFLRQYNRNTLVPEELQAAQETTRNVLMYESETPFLFSRLSRQEKQHTLACLVGMLDAYCVTIEEEDAILQELGFLDVFGDDFLRWYSIGNNNNIRETGSAVLSETSREWQEQRFVWKQQQQQQQQMQISVFHLLFF